MDNLSLALPSIPKPASNKVYTFQEPYPQHLSFSISLPIIRYIIKNPKSGPVWKKLIKTCKYFYSKSSLLPVGHISVDYFGDKYWADREGFDPSSFFPKLWIYDSFYNTSPRVTKSLVPKIYKFSLRRLEFGRQNFSWNGYKKLTASGTIESLTFYRTFVINDDGKIVPFDKLIENLHNLKLLIFSAYKRPKPHLFTSDSAKKMLEHLTTFKNMDILHFNVYAECVDFSFFIDFLMKNETIHVDFHLNYEVSDAMKKTIENVLKEIRQNPRLRVPRIV